MANADLMTQAEFARHINKTRGYVTQLKQAGRLVIVDGKVDAAASMARIEETADPNRDDVVARHAEARGDDLPQEDETDDRQADVGNGVKTTFADARAKEQHFKALRAELDYKKEIGELVDREAMHYAVTDLVTAFRQTFENMPHRLAPTLVGKDLEFIRSALRNDVVNALQALQKDFLERLSGVDEAV